MSSSISPNDVANIVIISESTKKLKEKRQKITQKASFVQYQRGWFLIKTKQFKSNELRGQHSE